MILLQDTPSQLFTVVKPIFIKRLILQSAVLASLLMVLMDCGTCQGQDEGVTSDAFLQRAVETLPVEKAYDYHRSISTGPIHQPHRAPHVRPSDNELALPPTGWNLVIAPSAGPIIEYAAQDFQEYLQVSMQVQIGMDPSSSLDHWKTMDNVIIAGTPKQLPGMGKSLKGPKDYEIHVSPKRIVVCGYDERGVMYGLFNLEARMTLRQAPIVPRDLKTIRHSLYQSRMVLSWLGWMEWPDAYLASLAHDGIDAIFASIYANPNGQKIDSTEFYATLLRENKTQKPAEVRKLIDRAAKYGIDVYTPIIFRATDDPNSEEDLRQLVRDNVNLFPEIRGFVLLTEGFYYDQWRHSNQDPRQWARKWCQAVAIVADECHKLNPLIEILPWEYNIDFRPQQADTKRYFISQLPATSIPLVTWENGKSFEIDGLRGHLKDYSISQVGPAEVTVAQIDEAKRRGMSVYSKADTFASWQFGTTPYIPAPYQWHRRYEKLREMGVDGTLESWSNGYKPCFMTHVRAWYCWSDSPPIDTLLRQTAAEIFGSGSEATVLKAWRHFSQAIQKVPDTGASMGTNFALANPLFLQPSEARTMTLAHSWSDPSRWSGYTGANIIPYWPYTHRRMVFYPDFTNQSHAAEDYAKRSSGIESSEPTSDLKKQEVLPVFNKYLGLAADEFEEGLVHYRKAALAAPATKRHAAMKEVLLVEQMQRMLRSLHAILEFEDLRHQLATKAESVDGERLMDRMAEILEAEISRTKASLLTAQRDSRLGYEYEQDYVYTPYVLEEKIAHLQKTLHQQLPDYRKRFLARHESDGQ